MSKERSKKQRGFESCRHVFFSVTQTFLTRDNTLLKKVLKVSKVKGKNRLKTDVCIRMSFTVFVKAHV